MKKTGFKASTTTSDPTTEIKTNRISIQYYETDENYLVLIAPKVFEISTDMVF